MADVMERLSAANPVPECSPPSIDEVWRRLEQSSTADEPPATGTTAGADRSGRRRRPDLALVGVGLSVLVVVAMFVGALALLHQEDELSGELAAGPPSDTGRSANSPDRDRSRLGRLHRAIREDSSECCCPKLPRRHARASLCRRAPSPDASPN